MPRLAFKLLRGWLQFPERFKPLLPSAPGKRMSRPAGGASTQGRSAPGASHIGAGLGPGLDASTA